MSIHEALCDSARPDAAFPRPLDPCGTDGDAADGNGNLYLSDTNNHRIRRIDRSGVITTVAGGGTMRGEGVAATDADLVLPLAITVDRSGNLYIGDHGYRVWRVDTSGIITAFAGVGGSAAFGGDGGPATAAHLWGVWDLAVVRGRPTPPSRRPRVRRVDRTGIITTIAGGGVGFGVDGVATDIAIWPTRLTFDHEGNLFISDGRWVRRLDSRRLISTVAGDGRWVIGSDGNEVETGDGGPARSAGIAPDGLAFDGDGNLYVGEATRGRARRIDTSGVITTIAGNGISGGN